MVSRYLKFSAPTTGPASLSRNRVTDFCSTRKMTIYCYSVFAFFEDRAERIQKLCETATGFVER
jgi:hypothetical protein